MPPRLGSSMTVRKACAVLNFPNPPTAKGDLKKRFVKLAKIHHPDLQETEEAKVTATEKMASVTEAYKLLKSLIDNKTAGGRIGGSAAKAGNTSAHWETDAAGQSFNAPGISKSSGDMWLPWQKSGPSRVVDTEKVLEDSTDFWAFKASVRKVEQRAASAAEHLNAKEGAGSAGSTSNGNEESANGKEDEAERTRKKYSGTQFTNAHFQKQKQTAQAIKGQSSRKSNFELLRQYLAARGPGRILESIRYIITGK